jgi:hypothetical protein
MQKLGHSSFLRVIRIVVGTFKSKEKALEAIISAYTPLHYNEAEGESLLDAQHSSITSHRSHSIE